MTRKLATCLVFAFIALLIWESNGAVLVIAVAGVLAAERYDISRQLRQEKKAQRRELYRDWSCLWE